MSRRVGARLFEVTSARGRWLRYPYQIWRTLGILRRERPSILFVQNPSMILSVLAVLSRRFFRIGLLVMDAHNAGIYPLEGRMALLNSLARAVFRRVDITIVTNPALADYVSGNGGRPVVIPDPLPDFGTGACAADRDHGRPLKAVFICTWSADEPWEDVIGAAAGLVGVVEIHITGKSGPAVADRRLPDNVILTGFLRDEAYLELLRSADFVIVLTRRENCLNCGAYEAVSLRKPLVLSDTQALRGYFSAGAVYTKSDVASITAAIRTMVDSLPDYSAQVLQLRQRLDADWDRYLSGLEKRISANARR